MPLPSKNRDFDFERKIFENFDENQFWKLIEYSKTLHPNIKEDQIDLLIDILSKREDFEIINFGMIKRSLSAKAYSTSLWGVCYLLFDYVSDDAFTDFENWIISEGKDKFYKLVNDPENFPNYFENKQELMGRSEKFYLICSYAYEKKYPESLDPDFDYCELFYNDERLKTIHFPQLKFDWETKEDLIKLYPKFYNKFCSIPNPPKGYNYPPFKPQM